MVDFVILHAGADSDRAQALARQTPDGAGLPAPIRAGQSLVIDSAAVRVALWSVDAAPLAGEFAASIAGGPCIVVTFDSTPLDSRFAALSPAVVGAAGDAVSTGRAMCAAAASALQAQRSDAQRGDLARLRPPVTPSRAGVSHPVARPARRGGFVRRAALATGVGAGATAISLASVAGYAANQDFGPLELRAQDISAAPVSSGRVSSGQIDGARTAPYARPAAADSAGLEPVRAGFDQAALSIDIHAAALAVSPTASDEISLRVEASLRAAREGGQAQLARFEELQRIAARVSRVAPVAAAANTEVMNLPVLTLSAVRSIPLELSGDRFAELAALEPVV